jgi:hypothetical protein
VDEESEDEYLEDFGAARLEDSELERLLGRARAAGDVELRRLVKEARMWRRIAPALLDRSVPAGSPVDEADALLKLARFVVRGEGKLGG